MRQCAKQIDLIGQTPVLKIPSLSKLINCEIFVKCEFLNPGGSIKDRAAKHMVETALKTGELREGMQIVEGTAGNTGIGLAVVAKSLGFDLTVVMPNDQAPEKIRLIELFGAKLHAVDPVPFKDNRHFYHTARTMAEADPEKCWWANQFENPANQRAHLETTGPEILEQLDGKLDGFICAAGTGGSIGGTTQYLKEKAKHIQTALIDPEGSGLCHHFHHGEFKSAGSSMTEGIGIMRLTENFKQAVLDDAFSLPDQDLVTISRFVQARDGIVLGSSSALNVAGAVLFALKLGKGSRVVTFSCDLGERSYSKLYNPAYLSDRGLSEEKETIHDLVERYRSM